MNNPDLRRILAETLDAIVEGRIVKRSKHELLWDGEDISDHFISALALRGFLPSTVGATKIDPGERIPAFYLENGTAFFGWVFWEKFSDEKMRKLFGSVVRNGKGDWAVQISPSRGTLIYTNIDLKTKMDIDNPSGI